MQSKTDVWETLQGAIRQAGSDPDSELGIAAVVANTFHSLLSDLGVVPAEFETIDLTFDDYSVPTAFGVENDDTNDTSRLFLYFVVGKPGAAKRETFHDQEVFESVARCAEFLAAVWAGDFSNLDELHPMHEIVDRLLIRTALSEIRLVGLVLGKHEEDDASSLQSKVEDVLRGHFDGGVRISADIWDIARTETALASDRLGGSVTIDVHDFHCEALSCVPAWAPNEASDDNVATYRSFLAVLPGALLADLFNHYGGRLLERNVRSFLQTRGKVNRGIQNTLLTEPERFFAYNNGVTITAAKVVLEDGKIRKLVDFQIVNGGQTTGSLHYAKYRSNKRSELDNVFVQAKITEIDLQRSQTFVEQVSRFSNSQNRVKESDFASSVPLHEELNRRSQDKANVLENGTSWFYEHARGVYLGELDRVSGLRKAAWEKRYPKRQRVDKLDAAKALNCWDMLPHAACAGNEKSHELFLKRLKSQPRFDVDNSYFRATIAKIIVFRQIDAIVKDLDLGGHKSAVVAHTYAVLRRKLLNDGLQLDLDKIWETGLLGPKTEGVVRSLVPIVRRAFFQSAGDRNVGEWAKKPGCHAEIMKDKAVHKLPYRTSLKSETTASVEDTMWAVAAVLDYLKAQDRPCGKNEIQLGLGGTQVLTNDEWTKARQFLLASGQIESKGHAKGTVYWAGE